MSKILYFADNYGSHNAGTKISIYNEMISRKHEIRFIDKKNIKNLLNYVSSIKPDQIWLAHSNQRLNPEVKKKLKIPVIGFGFSDPYYFSADRFKSYDIYITNHYSTYLKYQKIIPSIYNPTACDLRFHQPKQAPKNKDVSIIGLAKHPRFKNSILHAEIATMLRKAGVKTYCYGRGWAKHKNNYPYIAGTDFLDVIHTSKLGLDIQESWCPMAHRMFEYLASGIPVITAYREEVERLFDVKSEILVYHNRDELLRIVKEYLNEPEKRNWIAANGLARCRKDHNVSNRVDHILKELGALL